MKAEKIDISPYNHKVDLQVRYTDIGVLDHVNNAVYQQYFDFGKYKYFSDILTQLFSYHGDMLVMAKIAVNYFYPINVTETLEVYTRVISIRDKSLTVEQVLVGKRNEQLKAHAESVMVGYNCKTQQSHPIPDVWRERISIFEGKDF